MSASTDLDPRLQELLDRQAIWQVMLDYSRGIDRFDRVLLTTCYHPDAIDDHGVFVGGRDEFIDWAIGYHGAYQTAHHHGLSNHNCEIDGATAHCETYYHFLGVNPAGAHSLAMGRYIDRVERRDGIWRIAARMCVTEMVADLPPTALPEQWAAALFSNGPVSRDHDDVSYQRPLATRRPASSIVG